ncbi:MAG: hypothetical protein NVSMB6_23100 [Burkholderiaceae bacterium]
MVIFGILECGLLLWTQLGLQHGVEMAARCASINKTACGSTNAIQTYAAGQAYGLSIPSSTFTVQTLPPPADCNQVSASYTYQYVSAYFSSPAVTLSAQSCFPS